MFNLNDFILSLDHFMKYQPWSGLRERERERERCGHTMAQVLPPVNGQWLSHGEYASA